MAKPSSDVPVDKALGHRDRYLSAMVLQVAPPVERIAAQTETIGVLRKENEALQGRIAQREVPKEASIT